MKNAQTNLFNTIISQPVSNTVRRTLSVDVDMAIDQLQTKQEWVAVVPSILVSVKHGVFYIREVNEIDTELHAILPMVRMTEGMTIVELATKIVKMVEMLKASY